MVVGAIATGLERRKMTIQVAKAGIVWEEEVMVRAIGILYWNSFPASL